MLLKQESHIKPILKVSFLFEDNTSKEVELCENDTTSLVYNNAGTKVALDGKITKIANMNIISSNNVVDKKIYIVLDASTEMRSNVVRVMVNTILDITMINNEEVPIIPDPNVPIVTPPDTGEIIDTEKPTEGTDTMDAETPETTNPETPVENIEEVI